MTNKPKAKTPENKPVRRRTHMTGKVRKMIEAGASNQEVVAKLKCNPQIVYNVRYQLNKTKGLAALKKAQMDERVALQNAATFGSVVPKQETASVLYDPHYAPTPKPTFWQRIVNYFMGV